jgi:S1-C subfamily serine protease
MAKLAIYPVIKKTDRIRLELKSKQILDLTVTHSPPNSSKETFLFSQQLGIDRRIRIPGSETWFDFSQDQVGKQSLHLYAKTEDENQKVVVEFLLIENSSDSGFDTKAFASHDSKPNTLKLHANRMTHASIDVTRHTLELLSETQSFVEFEFLGTTGVDVYRDLASGVVKLLTGDGTCSGAVVNKTGPVVTNYHCVGDRREVLVVVKPPRGIDYTFSNFFVADIVRVDKSRDLALLSIREPPAQLNAVPLGNLSDVNVGMDAHAIGHPVGHNWSYTSGTISQIRPEYIWHYGEDYPDGFSATVIQTQTPSNPGNSGGPLFSDTGKLIGINSFGDTDAQGINFAVAINHVKDLINGVESRAKLTRPKFVFLGSADLNENGVIDTYAYDTNGNGKPDHYAIDDDEDDEPDYWLLDENENGVNDGKLFRDEYNGHSILVTLKDIDEDGEFDLQGIDVDADGKIDKYVSLLDST